MAPSAGRRKGRLPNWVVPAVIVLTVWSFIPLALVARARVTHTAHTRLQIVPDMDKQPKFKTQRANLLFADGRAMRPAVEGAVAYGRADLDSAYTLGRTAAGWTEKLPVALTPELLKRGQARFNIYCSPCHGLGGAGDGIVNARADRLQEGTWIPPSNLTSDLVTGRPVGHIFNTVTNGIRNMPAYGPQIPVADRWAIVAYVRALQRSQHATPADVPPDTRATLH